MGRGGRASWNMDARGCLRSASPEVTEALSAQSHLSHLAWKPLRRPDLQAMDPSRNRSLTPSLRTQGAAQVRDGGRTCGSTGARREPWSKKLTERKQCIGEGNVRCDFHSCWETQVTARELRPACGWSLTA